MLHILIDNGHGWDTIGKQSPDGRLHEYKYTRQVAHALVDRLKLLGYPCTLIVPEDNDVKLAERVRRVNEICTNNDCILISIHCDAQNTVPKWGTASGFSAWTYEKCSDKSEKLARCLINTVANRGLKVRKFNNDKQPNWPARFKILKETNCPAVLTENFFQDNKNDVDWLLENIDSVADYHVEAIKKYEKTLQ